MRQPYATSFSEIVEGEPMVDALEALKETKDYSLLALAVHAGEARCGVFSS